MSNRDQNVCEHGDHPAPPGKRFCSPECEECEHTECMSDDVACAGKCGWCPWCGYPKNHGICQRSHS